MYSVIIRIINDQESHASSLEFLNNSGLFYTELELIIIVHCKVKMSVRLIASYVKWWEWRKED